MDPEHFRTLARYNAWANERLYRACRALPEDAYHQKRDAAFFGSIHRTLHHILLVHPVLFDRVEGRDYPCMNALDPHLSATFRNPPQSDNHSAAKSPEATDRSPGGERSFPRTAAHSIRVPVLFRWRCRAV